MTDMTLQQAVALVDAEIKAVLNLPLPNHFEQKKRLDEAWRIVGLAVVAAPAPVAGDADVAVICKEASEVLEAVGVSGVNLPDNWRWPLADELAGIAALAQDRASQAKP